MCLVLLLGDKAHRRPKTTDECHPKLEIKKQHTNKQIKKNLFSPERFALKKFIVMWSSVKGILFSSYCLFENGKFTSITGNVLLQW